MSNEEFDAESMIKGLKELYQRYIELKKEIEEKENELQRILTKHGWTADYVREHTMYINKRWVLNKTGQKYYYFWLVIKRGSEIVQNIYLGAEVRKELEEEIADFKRAKEILRELKRLKFYKAVLGKQLEKIQNILM